MPDEPQPHDDAAEGAPPVYPPGASPFRPKPAPPLLERAVPVSADVPSYRPRVARADVLAGVTVAALAIPAAMGYAQVAGLSPVHGLYALLLPAVVYALLGSSRQAIVGPDGAVSAIVGATILPLAAAGSAEAANLAALLALIVAVIFLAAWALRLGWIADYISLPVMIGYLTGIGVTLIIGQFEKLTGTEIDADRPLGQLAETIRELDTVDTATLVVGAAALAVLVPLRFLAPRAPAALLVVVGAIVVSAALDLEADGVAVVGDVPAGLPRPAVPSFSLSQLFDLTPAALGLFFVAFADGVLIARAFAGKNGQHVRVGQEVLAYSGMEAAAGLTQGYPVGVSGSRTAVNDQMGSRTQFAGLIAAVAVAIVLVVATEPLSLLPSAVLGAVIVAAALGLLGLEPWRGLARTSRLEVGIAGVAAIGVVWIGVLQAILVAIALAVIDTTRRSARPHDAVLGWSERLGRWGNVALNPSAQLTEGVVAYRLDDRLFFANARYVKGRVREAIDGAPYHVRWLVFDAEAVSHVDATGAEALGELIAELRQVGIEFRVARMRSYVEERLQHAGIVDLIGADRFHPTVRAAVAACVAADTATHES